jgi:hypothetical protein
VEPTATPQSDDLLLCHDLDDQRLTSLVEAEEPRPLGLAVDVDEATVLPQDGVPADGRPDLAAIVDVH